MEGQKDDEGEKERNVSEIENGSRRKGKSCKGTLFYSSHLKSNGRNPRCVGFSRSLPQVPSYIVSESEVEASKEGRSLTDFKYACVGYSIFLDQNKDASSPPPTPPLTGDHKPRAELPVCIGIELLVDKRPADQQTPAHARTKDGLACTLPLYVGCKPWAVNLCTCLTKDSTLQNVLYAAGCDEGILIVGRSSSMNLLTL